jgi:hypothetical protein
MAVVRSAYLRTEDDFVALYGRAAGVYQARRAGVGRRIGESDGNYQHRLVEKHLDDIFDEDNFQAGRFSPSFPALYAARKEHTANEERRQLVRKSAAKYGKRPCVYPMIGVVLEANVVDFRTILAQRSVSWDVCQQHGLELRDNNTDALSFLSYIAGVFGTNYCVFKRTVCAPGGILARYEFYFPDPGGMRVSYRPV